MPVSVTVCTPESSTMERSAIGSRPGGSLTGLIVTLKVRVTILLEEPPSSNDTVIVAVPNALVTGMKLSEPVGFGEVYVIVGWGTMDVSLEMALMLSV